MAIIEESEFILNKYFEEFEFIEEFFPKQFKDAWGEIKREKRIKNQKILMQQKVETEKEI